MTLWWIIGVAFVLLVIGAIFGDEDEDCDFIDSFTNPWCPDYWLFHDDD